ncbi:MAG: hypothetical protein AAB944_02605 [Patescibacteria group bacterium]
MNKQNKVTIGMALGAAAVAAGAAAYFLYGSKGAEKRRTKIKGWMLKAKGEVLEKIEGLQEISEQEYHAIIGEVLSRYAKVKHIGASEASALEKELKKYWAHLKKEFATTSKKVAGKTKQSLGKVVRAVK